MNGWSDILKRVLVALLLALLDYLLKRMEDETRRDK